MLRSALLFVAIAASSASFVSAQATVHVESPDPNGTKTLRDQTAAAAIRNYVQAWESFHAAFENNRPDLLDRDFIGTAKEKLSGTIAQQKALGIRSIYQDHSHDIKIVFASPEGLSLQLIDDVEYDVQLIDQDKPGSILHVKTRYVAVMTPTETKWQVRVFQAMPE
jgi:hypothetical protein